MKLDYLKEKKELVSTVLLTVSVLSVVLMLLKVTGFLVAPAKAASALEAAVDQSAPDSKNLATQLGKFKKVADALKKSNLFSPPPPRQNPITAVMGIFGNEALINGKWYKVGDKVGDAEILAVNPISVETIWDGKKKTFSPIDGAAGPGGSSRSGRPTASSRGSSPGRPGMVTVQGSRPGGGGRPMGGGMPGMGGMSRERMQNMSDADRENFRNQMRERFENMSEGDRDRLRQQMRERMGGSRGGDRGGRGGGPGGGRSSRR